MDTRDLLIVLAEPTRLRIVELLAAAPRTVGEIAGQLGALQPQTTKHIQVLEAAGLVTVHRLGRRKIASLDRNVIGSVADWLGGLGIAHPSEPVIEQYRRAIEAEQQHLAGDTPDDLSFRIRRSFPATRATMWRAWTTEDAVRQWWSPAHFEVAHSVVEPVVGGRVRLELVEGDGAHHLAVGEFLVVRPDRELVFTLAPLGPDGEPLFVPRFSVSFESTADEVVVDLVVSAQRTTPVAAPALAGLEIGWGQLLDKLAVYLG